MGGVRGSSQERSQAAAAAGYSVRQMRRGDEDRVAEVHVQAWREAYAGLMAADYLAALDVSRFASAWRERLAAQPSPGARPVVGLSPSGEIVAIGSSGPSRDDDAPTPDELWAINVLAAEHGTGLADLLMGELVGDRPASLWVLDGNVRAQAFYERHGFVPDGSTKTRPEIGRAEVRMVRS
jgi:ribosomal protein S18 acetylase RimI-like enzyme